MSHIKQFLKAEVRLLSQMQTSPRIGTYCSINDFVLRNGINFEPAPLPKGVRRGSMKQCYMNAGRLALRRKDLIYCEGYALGVIPVMHGWLVTPGGDVLDVTWEEGTEYFGVPIKSSYLLKMMALTGTWGVIDQWTHGWPILKDNPRFWRHPMAQHPMRRQLVTGDKACKAKGQHSRPCADCPFARTAVRGWLAGTPEEWIKMVHGEARIDCHTADGAQCAGAAIYRSNVHKSPRDESLLILPPDGKRCFSSSKEFMEHHSIRGLKT